MQGVKELQQEAEVLVNDGSQVRTTERDEEFVLEEVEQRISPVSRYFQCDQ